MQVPEVRYRRKGLLGTPTLHIHIYSKCIHSYILMVMLGPVEMRFQCRRRRRRRGRGIPFTKSILHTILYLQSPARRRRCPVNATRLTQPAQAAAVAVPAERRVEPVVPQLEEQQLGQITVNSRAQRAANWAPMRQ